MGKNRTQHRNISVEQIAALEAKGLVHAGYDATRDKEIFHRSIESGVTADPQMIAREYYNTTPHDLVIERIGLPRFKMGSMAAQLDFNIKKFPSGSWVYCPHGYYKITFTDGTPFEGSLLANYGDRIGKGERNPSRPEYTPRVYAKR